MSLSPSASKSSRASLGLRNPQWAVYGAALIALIVYLPTLQLEVNGTYHPYKTDVGEIQNALPRWGTLHDSGYPLYALLGSAFVTVLRPLGIPPAAGASLFSAVWGAIAAGLLARLALDLKAPALVAMTAALLFALSTSMWVDASIAEVHTMTMALTLGALLAAVRFGRSGQPKALYWLAFLAGQGVAHQRSFAFLGPGLLVLVLPQWRVVVRKWIAVLGLGLSGLLTYLYVPLQAWAGATWFFVPFSWENLWSMVANTKADVIVSLPQTLAELWARLTVVVDLLADDCPLPLLLAGLAGLWWGGPEVRRRERWGLTLTWIPYLAVSLIIWEGRVSDALLAVKMPIVALAALGLALLVHSVWQWKPVWGKGLVAAGLAIVVLLFVGRRPQILALTRDGGAREAVAMVSEVAPDPGGRPTAFVAYWGDAYWQLAYAQGIEGQFPDLLLMDHNRDFGALLTHGYRLLTFSWSFGVHSLPWWEERVGATVHLTSVAPGIVEVKTAPEVEPAAPRDGYVHVFDGAWPSAR
jgi:hypothetical protein